MKKMFRYALKTLRYSLKVLNPFIFLVNIFNYFAHLDFYCRIKPYERYDFSKDIKYF